LILAVFEAVEIADKGLNLNTTGGQNSGAQAGKGAAVFYRGAVI